jgi:hypothetical protein
MALQNIPVSYAEWLDCEERRDSALETAADRLFSLLDDFDARQLSDRQRSKAIAVRELLLAVEEDNARLTVARARMESRGLPWLTDAAVAA